MASVAALALAALPASVAVDALLDRCVPLMRAVCGAVRAADAWRCSAYDARSNRQGANADVPLCLQAGVPAHR